MSIRLAVKVFQIVTPSHNIWSKYLMIATEYCFCCAIGYRQVYIIGDYDAEMLPNLMWFPREITQTNLDRRNQRGPQKQFSLIRGLIGEGSPAKETIMQKFKRQARGD